MYSNDEIIEGIKNRDRKIWEFLYSRFYPLAKKHVKRNSGNTYDAEDLVQKVFFEIFRKCTKGYYHDNIMAIITETLKMRWLDELRKRKQFVEIEEAGKVPQADKTSFYNGKSFSSETHLKKEFGYKEDDDIELEKGANIEDFLNYRGLNDVQKKMIEVLLDNSNTSPICKKILLRTEYLPIDDNERIARELGYIQGNDKETIKKGLDTLKTQKARCLKKFKESLGLKK